MREPDMSCPLPDSEAEKPGSASLNVKTDRKKEERYE